MAGVPSRGTAWDHKGVRGGGRRGSGIEEEPSAQADLEQPGKQEENPAALGLLEAKRNRKHAAGSNAAKGSGQVRTEDGELPTGFSNVEVTGHLDTSGYNRVVGAGAWWV